MIYEHKIMDNITEEHLKQYEQYLKGEGRSQTTVKKYLRDIRRFRGYLNTSDSGTFDKEQILGYKQYLNEHYKTTSTNPMLVAINNLFDYLEQAGCKVHLSKIQRVQFCEPERELTEENYERLIQTTG